MTDNPTSLLELAERRTLFSDPETWTEAEIERTRARILRDVDPVNVERDRKSREEFAKRVGTPKRCKTNEVHPVSGECLFCGAIMGQSCQLGFGG